MSDVSGGPGWWQASDGKWYPPEARPAAPAPSPPPGYGYGPPPAYGYGYAYGYSPQGPPLPSVQGQAVASLALGIGSVVLCCLWFVSGVLAVIGLVLGIIALRKINAGEADPASKGLAIAGIALSAVGLVLGVVLLGSVVVSSAADAATVGG